MNWGTKIAVLYVGFATLMIVLVTMSVRQKFDLVSKDYYQKELAFQGIIDAGKNQSQLSAPVQLQQNEQNIRFIFPAEFAGKNIQGSVDFYAAANEDWDQHETLNTAVLVFSAAKNKLHHTAYHVKISWQAEGKSYFQDSELNIN